MFLLKLPVLFTVVFSAVNAFPTKIKNTEPIGWNPHDLTQGYVTKDSVLLFSGLVNGSEFEWRGPNLISAINVQNRNNSGPLRGLEVRGGFQSDFLQLWSHVGPINALVDIYAQPINEIHGWLNTDFEVVNTTIVQGVAPQRFSYDGTDRIQAVEIVDRTSGTGVYAMQVDGIGGHSLDLLLASALFRGQVNVIVRIYAETRNFQVGHLTDSSVLLTKQVITHTNLTSNGVVEYRASDDHTIDLVHLIDLTKGIGARVRDVYLNENEFFIFFEDDSVFEYMLEVYGNVRNTTDDADTVITVGELVEGSILLESHLVEEFGTHATAIVPTAFAIDRIEVRNLNQISEVTPTLALGEVGGRLVVVLFEAAAPTHIQFEVNVFGRLQ